jgi:hypothetical protein
MREMMDPEHWKQRREEMVREAELSRRTRALRATRKRTGWRSAWTWAMRMYAGQHRLPIGEASLVGERRAQTRLTHTERSLPT